MSSLFLGFAVVAESQGLVDPACSLGSASQGCSRSLLPSLGVCPGRVQKEELNPKISLPSWSGGTYWAGGECCGFCLMEALVGYWFYWAWRGCLFTHQPCSNALCPARTGAIPVYLLPCFLSLGVPCLCCVIPLLCWPWGLCPPR